MRYHFGAAGDGISGVGGGGCGGCDTVFHVSLSNSFPPKTKKELLRLCLHRINEG